MKNRNKARCYTGLKRFKVAAFTTAVALILVTLAACGPPSPQIPTAEIGQESETDGPKVIAEDLSIPWEILFLPNNVILLTERTGSVTFIAGDGAKRRIGFPDVSHTSGGEGGLLGAALDPNFSENRLVYFYSTYDSVAGEKRNRVDRFKLTGTDINDFELTEETPVLDSIPGAVNHDGGRIKFGPDGFLYITVGDALSPEKAQDQNTLHGSILRVTSDGDPVLGNPFENPVFSYGHRNPQGLTWDDAGTLWSTEHGPSGFGSGFDELNRIDIGGNYGWPTIQGDETADGLESPAIHSGSRETWAPGSAEYHAGRIYFGGLRGQAIYEFNPSTLSVVKYFSETYGRVRTVRVGQDGSLYFTTSNTDGRGRQNAGDDKLYRVDLPLNQK